MSTTSRFGAARERALWASVLARDPAATFVFAVRTTKIYCRPSCPARRARRENVTFYRSGADARRAGYRACKRCTPDATTPIDATAERVATMCRFIESSEASLTLAELGRHAGVSPFHAHRLFKSITGLTPRAYAAAHRAKLARSALDRGESVTSAIFDAGYGSTSRFYATAGARLGMNPSRYKDGGRGESIGYAIGRSTLGNVLVAATARGVCVIALGDDEGTLVRDLEARFPRARIARAGADLEKLVARAVRLVENPARKGRTALPLDVRGTAFQERVWRALVTIPPGTTASYGELAERLGKRGSARAVARACASNPLAVAIPCHRVVGADGDLSGYRWGLDRKRELLARESKTAVARASRRTVSAARS